MNLKFFFLSLIILVTAFPSPATNLKINKNKLEKLAQSPTWLKLLHFEKSLLSNNFTPAIHSSSFYFSKNNFPTPFQELTNTLTAFITPGSFRDINQHPQCRFPARFKWLDKELSLETFKIKKIECPKYRAWSKYETLDSISLIFATGYLGNPASYYGHTLIKLNSSENADERQLDISINFGADVPKDEDPVSYIIKGLVGGYDGSFTHSKYYFHTHNYLENELRNMWEYKLNLSIEDQQFLLAHIWELIEQDYTYYFLNKNCVSRMYELFSLIDGVELPEMNPIWVVPQEVIKAINNAKYNGTTLIKEVSYMPSRQTQFYDKFWQLSKSEKAFASDIINNFNKLNFLYESKITTEQKFRVLSVLLDYYQFVISQNKEDQEVFKEKYDQVLAARYRLPIGKPRFNLKKPRSPHQGRNSGYSHLSLIHNQSLGNGYKIKLRPTYYDQLDGSVGHIKNATLKMGEIEFEQFNSKIEISSLTIFDVISVKNQATGLPKDDFDSWKLYLGLNKQDSSCQNCLAVNFKADKGWAFPLSLNSTLGFYVGGALIENRQNRGRAYLSNSAFYNHSITDNWKIQINVEALKFIEKSKYSTKNYTIESRYQFNIGKTHMDARFGFRKDNTKETFAGIGYYW